MQHFEKYLLANLPKATSFHPHYEKALGEMIIAGGKRFRPLLMLSVIKALNPLLIQNSYPVALAIEMLHTYSLIHDDLPAMDDSPLRRGHPTLHITYDEVTAILAGDALNTHAFYLIANASLNSDTKVELVKILAENGGANGMVLGQAIDCHFENQRLYYDQLEFIHIHKTAKLIAASLKMGAVIASSDHALSNTLYDLGIRLGLFFQVRDDIIDATSDEKTAGKPVNNDEVKNSFVTILGLDQAKSKLKSMQEEIVAELDRFDQPLKDALFEVVGDYFA